LGRLKASLRAEQEQELADRVNGVGSGFCEVRRKENRREGRKKGK
jgi:hypothetical protein